MITAEFVGLGEAMPRLRRLTPKILAETKISMARLVTRIQTHVKVRKLSGQVLNRRSGNLSRNIFTSVEETRAGVIGKVYVGSTAPYGKVHEYGETVTVGAYERNVPSHKRTINQAFGRPIPSMTVTVRAHTASVGSHTRVYPERSFLRSSLKEYRGEFRKLIQEIIDKSVGKK